MKKVLISLLVLILAATLSSYALKAAQNNKAVEKNFEVITFDTDSHISETDIINAFGITHLYKYPRAEHTKLNNLQPRAFPYHEGKILIYIFENKEECNRAVLDIPETFTEEILLKDGLIEFKQPDFRPYIYRANNAIIAYIPKYTISTQMVRSMEGLVFRKEAETKGLTSQMIGSLANLGFSNEEMLSMSQEKLDIIFAPGTHLGGGGFDFLSLKEDEQNKLIAIGIGVERSMILYNLGYEFEDMINITPQEMEFIFPNTKLISKLETAGFSKKEIDKKLQSGLTYKDLIKEASK